MECALNHCLNAKVNLFGLFSCGGLSQCIVKKNSKYRRSNYIESTISCLYMTLKINANCTCVISCTGC